MASLLVLFSAIAFGFFCIAFAFEPPFNDFCVADSTSSVRVNGLPCKNPATVTVNDFSLSGLHLPGNTSNPYGSAVASATVGQIPGLNTLGIAAIRFDFAPNGVIPPHIHPRATELLIVLEGSLEVGFVASAPSFAQFNRTLRQGDVFVFPVGLVHFLFNSGTTSAVAIGALNSENPGFIGIPNAVFGATPDLNTAYLAKVFQVDTSIIQQLQARN